MWEEQGRKQINISSGADWIEITSLFGPIQ